MIRSVGILGGTFDPIHNAHIDLARKSLEYFGLDSILFIPANIPPHKGETYTTYENRVAMVKLAIADYQHFSLSRIEEKIEGPSYTVKTIKRLSMEKEFVKTELYLIVGLDTFNDIQSWYQYEDLLSLVHFIVVGRKGHDKGVFLKLLKELGYEKVNSDQWTLNVNRKLAYLDHQPPGIASSDIRLKIAKKEGISLLLPPQVFEYIKNNQLYGCNHLE